MLLEEEWKLTTFVGVGCLAVVIWDVLHSLAADYRLVFKRKFNIKTLSFVASRVSTISYLSVVTVQMTRATSLGNDYTTLKIVASIFFLISRTTTALLFYFRVIAIYRGHYCIIAFFTTTWILTVAGGILALGPVWKTTSVIPPWQYFLPGALTEILNDTLVFVAISRKIRVESPDSFPEPRLGGVFILRLTDVQRIAETFLQDSQIYYFIAICMNLATIITYFSAKSQSPTRIMLIYPNTVVMHIMATKVYRNLRLGRPGLLAADSTSTWMYRGSGSAVRPCPISNLKFSRSAIGLQDCECGRGSLEARLRGSGSSVDPDDIDLEAGHGRTKIPETTSLASRTDSESGHHGMDTGQR